MAKYIFTFGSCQLPEFKGNPMKVMLVVEADSENYARRKVFDSSIGDKFCTSYPYTDERVEEFEMYGISEYTLKDLGV